MNDQDFNPGRLQGKRNRQVTFTPLHVQTDGQGNILVRPLVRSPRLDCFALPKEYWRGVSDVPHRKVMPSGEIVEKPWGCAGCRVRAACAKVVYERVQSSANLDHAHRVWESATAKLPVSQRYSSSEWVAFAGLCDRHQWTDSHDAALDDDKAHRRQVEKKRRRLRARANRARDRQVTLSDCQVQQLRDECDRRWKALCVLRRNPDAPRWIGRRSEDQCLRVAAVWMGEQFLRAQRLKVTNRAIAEIMIALGYETRISATSLGARVAEILPKLAELEGGSRLDPLRPWRPFQLK